MIASRHRWPPEPGLVARPRHGHSRSPATSSGTTHLTPQSRERLWSLIEGLSTDHQQALLR